jgi:hypothetical protein
MSGPGSFLKDLNMKKIRGIPLRTSVKSKIFYPKLASGLFDVNCNKRGRQNVPQKTTYQIFVRIAFDGEEA